MHAVHIVINIMASECDQSDEAADGSPLPQHGRLYVTLFCCDATSKTDPGKFPLL